MRTLGFSELRRITRRLAGVSMDGSRIVRADPCHEDFGVGRYTKCFAARRVFEPALWRTARACDHG